MLFLIAILQRQHAHAHLCEMCVCAASLSHPAFSCSYVFPLGLLYKLPNDTCFPPSDLSADKLHTTAGWVGVCVYDWQQKQKPIGLTVMNLAEVYVLSKIIKYSRRNSPFR